MKPLTNNEYPGAGASWMHEVKAEHLTEASNNTDQVLTVYEYEAGEVLQDLHIEVAAAFADADDAAFNDVKISVGTELLPDRFMPAKQVAANGEPVLRAAVGHGTPTVPVAFQEPGKIVVRVSGMSGKALKSLDQGSMHVFMRLADPTKFNN